MSPIRSQQATHLFEAILTLRDSEECYHFFEDLCTIKEIEDMAQRLAVAEGLLAGKTFSEIGKETGASSATISRVNKCILYGSGGYKTVLNRLTEQQAEKDEVL